MAIISPQAGINGFHQDIIDLRARLIAQESTYDKLTKKALNDMLKEWEKFIKGGVLGKFANNDYPKALAARRLAILKGMGKITGKMIATFQSDIADRSLSVFEKEYFRHSSLLDQLINDSQKKQLSK